MRSSRAVRKSLFLGAVAVASVALLACSALLGDFEVGPGTGAVDTGAPVGDSGPKPGDGSTLDTGTNDAGEDGAKVTYCDGVVAPPGAVQFLCADFDTLVLGKGWDDVLRTDGGILEKTQDVAVSLPAAMVSGVTGGPAEGALLWKRPGAKEFEEVTARTQINATVLGGVVPPATFVLDLIDLRTSNSSVTFGYSRGSTNFGGGVAYYGYYVTNAVFGGAAALNSYKVSAVQLQPNIWTDLKLVWNKSGKIDLFYNGISVFSVGGFASSDTVVNVKVGAHAAGSVGAMPLHRFDNVELSIRRAP